MDITIYIFMLRCIKLKIHRREIFKLIKAETIYYYLNSSSLIKKEKKIEIYNYIRYRDYESKSFNTRDNKYIKKINEEFNYKDSPESSWYGRWRSYFKK